MKNIKIWAVILLSTLAVTAQAQFQLGSRWGNEGLLLVNGAIFKGPKQQIIQISQAAGTRIPQLNDGRVVVMQNQQTGQIAIYLQQTSRYGITGWRILTTNSSKQMPRFEKKPSSDGYTIYWGKTKDAFEIDF